MIIYMLVSNSVENSSKLHILLATIVAGGRAQNVRSGQLLHRSFHSLFHFSSSRITLKGSACLSPQKLSETARMLTVSVIPVRRNNATLFETKRQRHISVLFSNRLLHLSDLLISTRTHASRWCLYMQRSDSFRLM